MKELVIISGKGGTGKTTVTASIAAMAQNAVICDCDVDAPNLHLLLRPIIQNRYPFYGMDKAKICFDKCTKCYLCQDVCNFNAINDELVINKNQCEGCGICENICESNAIEMIQNRSGTVFSSRTDHSPMIHAELVIGEEASGKLVSVVKEHAYAIATKTNADLVIVDGPPGTGCPVLATITGADLALIVTEPSISGIHDLERVLQVTDHFETNAVVCINKYDINENNTKMIEDLCHKRNIDVVGKIPYTKLTTAAMREERTIVDYNNDMSFLLKKIWEQVRSKLEDN